MDFPPQIERYEVGRKIHPSIVDKKRKG